MGLCHADRVFDPARLCGIEGSGQAFSTGPDPVLDRNKPDAPWPVRKGDWTRALYSHSQGLALLALFNATFMLHVWNSIRRAAQEALWHGHQPETMWHDLVSGQFWFESFQNWQSEFLSTALLILLAVFLRERGSPESKPVSDRMTRQAIDRA
ncbi:DUF6766 family protein [Mesorhizobium sp. M00.F.Ca.ET.216.01.1.1]|uniref:DUF6766 family protein n=1 Tax=Mesorhizobium sp. M00.F.Ca.ET.216.01.1.1 TaxID=2500528 RepID=UPI0032AF5FAE